MSSGAPREAPYYTQALSLGLTAFLTGIHLWTWVLYLPLFLGGRADFRPLYTAGYLVRTGHATQIYDYATQHRYQDLLVGRADIAMPFLHPAHEALLFVPYSLLPFREAYLAFLGTNLAMLYLAFRCLRPRMDNIARVYPWLPAALCLAFLPIAAALIQGQTSILLLLLFILAHRATEQGGYLRAGLLVGLGVFKLQIALPIAVLFLLWRQWRFAAGFLVSASLAAGVSAWMTGGVGPYGDLLLAISVGLRSSAEQFKYAIPVAMMPNLRGLFSATLGAGQAPVLATAAASIAVLGSLSFLKHNRFLAAIPASLLVSYHVLIHDMAVLFLPLVVVLDACITREVADLRDPRDRLLPAAAVLFVSPMTISFAPHHFYLVAIPTAWFLVTLLPRSVSLADETVATDLVMR